MLRLSSLLIFAAFLAYGLAQMTTTTEATTTEAKAPTTDATTEETTAATTEAKTTTAPEAKPTTHTTEAPATTTQPQPPPPGHYSYSDANGTCMNVIGNMTLSVTYENETEKHVKLTFDLNDPDSMAFVNPDNCSCSSSAIQTFGFKFVVLNESQEMEQFITITFRNENKAWNASEVTFNFNTDAYPDLNVSKQEFLEFKAKGNLFQTNVDLGNSYSCGSAELTFDSAAIDYKLNATLTIDSLRVQAFYTSDMHRGDLGAAQDCASSKGNKIVPIAVGAALAGLVIVVLIAYLIGRLKSRKQSSYEALS